jgi:hypothetical protein
LSQVYLHQQELADRWRISPRTLERWRWRKSGPSYHKIGGRVVYAVDDVEAYERRRRAEIKPTILGNWR